MSVFLFRLGRWAFHHRRLVLLVWCAVAVAAVTAATTVGGEQDETFTIPGTEAQRTTDLLERKLPEFGGGDTQVVFAAPEGATLTDDGPRAGVTESLERLARVPQVAQVADPYEEEALSRDGRVALGSVRFAAQPGDVREASLTALDRAVRPAREAGVAVEYSGSVYPGWNEPPSELPELVGLIAALVILLVTFGSLVAAGIPVLTAVLGVLVTIMGITLAAAVFTIASATTTVAIMLGLSCGIDYGLFVLYRHRNNLLAGMAPAEAAAMAAGTAGGSVVFAALTVIIALCGLSVVGIPFLTVMGLCAAGAVLMAMLIALTLLPAVLGFAGDRVVRFVRFPGRPGHAERVARRTAGDPEGTRGAAWARFVTRHKALVVVACVVLLGLLALPATSMRLGLPSGAAYPTSETQRRAYDLIADGFGVGANGPLLVVADHVTDAAVPDRLAERLGRLPDVAHVRPLVRRGDLVVLEVTPDTGPDDPATADLVHRIRDDRDAIEGDTGARVLVGGTTASNIDVSAKLSSALPEFLLVVVGLAFLLLTFAFRTVLVPLKSIAGFLLSVLAALGAQVAMFQWGWGEDLFDIVPTETISFLPTVMLAIIFGLSSDYEVFVVSRVKEVYHATGDAAGAAARGTALSARVVTAAALIMFGIFLAFMLTGDPIVRAIGFAFAVGVLLDAFVVRLTLVPAVLALAGRVMWWHPRWVDRLVPDPDIEGHRLTAPGPGGRPGEAS